MAEKVEVLDSIMGSGKTTAIMQWMKDNWTDRYIYISPLLDEVEGRLVDELPELEFATPSNAGMSKSEDLLNLLREGRNIGTTHALFKIMTREHMKLIADWEYVVVVDEELEMIMPFVDYKAADFKWLYSNGDIAIEEDHKLVWKAKEMPEGTKYHLLRALCDIGILYASKRDWSMVTVQLPIELITCAKRVVVLTYLFEGSVFDKFLQMKGIRIDKFTEVDVKLQIVDKNKIRELITFIGDTQNDKLDEVYRVSSFSSNWYKTSSNDLTIISKYIRNVCRAEDAKAEDVMWTAKGLYVKEVKKSKDDNEEEKEKRNQRLVKPAGYLKYKEGGELKSCWVGCSAKATNAYQNKSVLVHCYNRYPHRILLAFMQDCGYPIEDGRFALAEMLQWIWRSRIRKWEPIKLAILPKRMRMIFKDWLYNKEN